MEEGCNTGAGGGSLIQGSCFSKFKGYARPRARKVNQQRWKGEGSHGIVLGRWKVECVEDPRGRARILAFADKFQ